MKASLVYAGLLLALTACVSGHDQGWMSLFDGRSLGRWQGDPNVWRVENGYIVGKAERVGANTFLIYPEEFANFTLEAEVMLIEAGSFPNSGIQFRSRVVGPFAVQGYQVDVGRQFWGSLYEEGKGPMADTTSQALQSVRADDWNQLVIRTDGQRLSVRLNGVEAAQYDSATVTRGIIALQYHAPGENYEVRFRNLRIRKLE